MNDTATGSWKLERDSDDIAWLTIDKPGTSANVLSGGVLGELDALLAALEKDLPRGRSEERRVGKECRSRWAQDHEKKKKRRRGRADTTVREQTRENHTRQARVE